MRYNLVKNGRRAPASPALLSAQRPYLRTDRKRPTMPTQVKAPTRRSAVPPTAPPESPKKKKYP